MKIDVREIKQGLGLSRDVCFEQGTEWEGVLLASPLQARLTLTHVGQRILLRGDLSGSVRVTCSRCAGDADEALEVRVEEQFLPVGSPELPTGEELDLEQLDMFTYEGDEIELGEVIRQNLVASLPPRPLCRPDCLGLCAACGVNFNETTCQCGHEPAGDPRWGPLAELMARRDTEAGD